MADLLLTLVFVGLCVGASACLVYWGATLGRVVRTCASTPTADEGLALAGEHPPTGSVCVLIPAHNEADEIAALVASLRAQDHASVRFVLCCDRCTDGTADRARRAAGDDPRFEVLEIHDCPPDWAGKVHALWTGVARSSAAQEAELLLFADADTRFHPACVRATAALLEHLQLDAMSMVSTMTTAAWFEKLVQPAAGLELFYQYPLTRTNRGRTSRPFFNGQFMLFKHEAYEAIGGHESVREELLEDLAIARHLARAKRRVGVVMGGRMLTCRMYDTWGGFREGWKRIYTEAAKRRVRRLRRSGWRIRLASVALPVLAAGSVVGGLSPLGDAAGGRAALLALGLGGLAVWLAALVMIYRIGRHPVWMAPTHLVGAWLVSRLLTEAGRDLRAGTPVRWGGRTYVRPQR
ncbi:MAG: glycosyltransferase [Phycisphaerales bacterium]|nr:MAG: glycosyltransferase [Phycisphaerales bacterium]